MLYKKLLLTLLSTLPAIALCNDIDNKCPGLTFKTAPVVNADQFICHQQYAIAYSYKTKTPIYTTEYLTISHTGNIARTNNFRVDPEIPSKYSAKLSDYSNTTTECNGMRCDRGHMTPNQDFSSDLITTSESFFLSNIVPQNFKNNEIIWKYLEIKVRQYVSKINSVYVITGPVYLNKKYSTIGSGVAIPDKLFKVIIDSKTGKSISFLMENNNIPVSALPEKVVSLYDIEKVTGISFDKSLNKKSVSNYKDWF